MAIVCCAIVPLDRGNISPVLRRSRRGENASPVDPATSHAAGRRVPSILAQNSFKKLSPRDSGSASCQRKLSFSVLCRTEPFES